MLAIQAITLSWAVVKNIAAVYMYRYEIILFPKLLLFYHFGLLYCTHPILFLYFSIPTFFIF